MNIPSEILITTMQSHQKYLPTFDKKNNLTNNFFVVSDIKDIKGFVKLGNERVIEARLSDAEFFWEKNKTQNLVKQVDKLKNINDSSNIAIVPVTKNVGCLSGYSIQEIGGDLIFLAPDGLRTVAINEATTT